MKQTLELEPELKWAAKWATSRSHPLLPARVPMVALGTVRLPAKEVGAGGRVAPVCPNASDREGEPGERRQRESRRGRRACWTPMTEGDPPGEDTQRESRREERERERQYRDLDPRRRAGRERGSATGERSRMASRKPVTGR